VLLAIGSSLTRSSYAQSIRPEATLIHNTNNADEVGKDEAVDIGLLGDARLTLQALIAAVSSELDAKPRDASTVTAEIARVRAAWYAQ
jgi:thiamine pyrophosphate-dependent acetolactate synthase large subunit-like protein